MLFVTTQIKETAVSVFQKTFTITENFSPMEHLIRSYSKQTVWVR